MDDRELDLGEAALHQLFLALLVIGCVLAIVYGVFDESWLIGLPLGALSAFRLWRLRKR